MNKCTLKDVYEAKKEFINNDSITKSKCNDSEMIKQFIKERR